MDEPCAAELIQTFLHLPSACERAENGYCKRCSGTKTAMDAAEAKGYKQAALDCAAEEALAEVPGLNAPPSAEQLAMLAEADAKFAADAIDWEQERAAFNAWFEQGDKLPFTPWHAWQARAALAAHEAGRQLDTDEQSVMQSALRKSGKCVPVPRLPATDAS